MLLCVMCVIYWARPRPPFMALLSAAVSKCFESFMHVYIFLEIKDLAISYPSGQNHRKSSQ